MAAIVDTNILVRMIFNTESNPEQHEKAKKIMRQERLVVPTVVFCEFVWVLRSCYKKNNAEIAKAIRIFLDAPVITNKEEVHAGLEFLENGGDFADGVVVFSGRRLARNKGFFVSFDRDAVRRALRAGFKATNAEDF